MKHRWFQPLLLPFTILAYVATLLILPFYRPVAWRRRAGCIELIAGTKGGQTRIWGRPAGQCWGVRVIWYSSEGKWNKAKIRVHERVHILHGEWINAAAHGVFVPLAVLHGGKWYLLGAIILGQLAFGIAYLGHFLYLWKLKGLAPWRQAYRQIWTERIAYRVQMNRDVWGS